MMQTISIHDQRREQVSDRFGGHYTNMSAPEIEEDE